VGARVDALVGM